MTPKYIRDQMHGINFEPKQDNQQQDGEIERLDNIAKVKRRIDIFTYVRDIPYSLKNGKREDIEKEQKANCYAKSIYLRELLEAEGYKTRSITFPYRLRGFPDEVQYIPKQIDYHYALQVLLGNNWIAIDPSYDSGLRGGDFQINIWDGISSTLYCENPIGPIQYGGEKNEEFESKYKEFIKEIEHAYALYPKELKRYTEVMEQYILDTRISNNF